MTGFHGDGLPALLRAALTTPHYAETLAGIDPDRITDRAGLATLPVLRKSTLAGLQAARPPFAGINVRGPGDHARVFASPGGIHEAQPRGTVDHWGMAAALDAAGFRAGDIVHNAFSYHLTPAGAAMEAGAWALGCAVFPAGIGNTEAQIAAALHLKPAGYTGTPSFLLHLLRSAAAAGTPLPFRHALVSGEAFPPAMAAEIAGFGVVAIQCYGTAEIGMIAHETLSDGVRSPDMLVNARLIVEILTPGTGDPVVPGAVGEVVVTRLDPDWPLIRFATGDLSAEVLPAQVPAQVPIRVPVRDGAMRIRGWLGRADDGTKVKGQFVYPMQVAGVLARHPAVTRGRLVIGHDDGRDSMTLLVETGSGDEISAGAIAADLAALTRLKGEVRLVAVGRLPDDGRLIEDMRS
ncbi:phenylacetate--CoA ligase [Tistrella bauzanensis]|uniref:Phenylacetate--CoA ligase n=1 Tax=Tistrella bauzanensis TaxID=657419 RepID=A0ABQ1IEN6_9PROT|nr:phenylacetate--CoA ligase family protein [Tistrella bauzanensis]GGB36976.1 phenylacetate--CoA ligase [Tistrella bauzanensis]